MMNGTNNNSWNNESYEVENVINSKIKSHLLNLYYEYYTYVKIYRLVTCLVVCLLGTIGNGLVIWFSCRMEKTVNVIWFLNLAIVDFSFALVLPVEITHIALDGQWTFGNLVCKFTRFLFFFNMSASVLQLTVISVDRCICVVFPVWCHNHRTVRLALIVVLIIWAISIALNLPYVIFKDTLLARKIYCFSNDVIWVLIVRFVFFFLVPVIVFISCYTVIVLRLKEKKKKSSKPVKIIAVIVITFFVCWFPYYLCICLFRIFQLRINLTVRLFVFESARGLTFFNTCINPILYVFIGRDFKQKFCGSFQAIFGKAFKDDMDKINLKKHGSSSGITLTSSDINVI